MLEISNYREPKWSITILQRHSQKDFAKAMITQIEQSTEDGYGKNGACLRTRPVSLDILLGILEGITNGNSPPKAESMINLLLQCQASKGSISLNINDSIRQISEEYCTTNSRLSSKVSQL